jgi:lincosamide nucleotidyltransferase A/C/D/E
VERDPARHCHALHGRCALRERAELITRDDVLEVLRRLDDAGIEWWIDGGWAVDALLSQVTREHDDLDLAVPRAQIETLEATFPEFRRVRDEWPASFVLADSRGRQIDVHPLTFDEHGNGWLKQPNGETVCWPREALAGRGRIGDRDVRCTSPEFLVKWKLYPGHDDVDRSDIELLCQRFGLEQPSAAWPGVIHPKRAGARRVDH